MKKILAILLSLALLCGCQSGPDPAEMGEALCRLYVHGDTAVSELLKDWDAQSIRDTIERDLHRQLKENLEAVGAVELNEDSLQAVTEAMLAARERIPVQAELLESDRQQAVVKITVGALDLSNIDAAAAQEALKAIEALDKEDETRLEFFVECYLEALQAGFEEADAESETTSFEVTFRKENGLWLPEDLNGFIAQLGQLIRR